MLFDEFGISNTIDGKEGSYTHRDFGDQLFDKSSFMKEWADKYLDDAITVVFDIGALDAGDSLRFSLWYPAANIYSIEASSHNFKVLNKKLGNKRPNIKTFNNVMSSTNGQVVFYQTSYSCNKTPDTGYMIMGSIYDYKDIERPPVLNPAKPVVVESITYDTFCENNNITNVDIAHVDIEGAGFNFSLGMNKVLPKMIFMEKERRESFKNKNEGGNVELVKLLESKGYVVEVELVNDYLFILK